MPHLSMVQLDVAVMPQFVFLHRVQPTQKKLWALVKNETLKLILDLYPDCLELEGQFDNTALTMAMMKDQRETIKLLIDRVIIGYDLY